MVYLALYNNKLIDAISLLFIILLLVIIKRMPII